MSQFYSVGEVDDRALKKPREDVAGDSGREPYAGGRGGG